MEGPTLESPMPFVIMKRKVILYSGTGAIVLVWFRTLHLGLGLDAFKDVLDRELQRGEAIIHSVSSEWALLMAQEWTLLESALPVTRVVDGGASVMWLRVFSIIAVIERLVGEALHCFL